MRRWNVALGLLAGWAIVAYLVAPGLWEWFYGARGGLAQAERVTKASDGDPGDPVNTALAGDEAQVVRAMLAAGWHAADPITLESSLRIAVDSVLRRPDADAPVSNLYLFGRRQDLAFELPVPGGPRHRHHVRFWKWDRPYDGRSLWFGAATYDERAACRPQDLGRLARRSRIRGQDGQRLGAQVRHAQQIRDPTSRMRENRTSGSVGALGGTPPRSTQQAVRLADMEDASGHEPARVGRVDLGD